MYRVVETGQKISLQMIFFSLAICHIICELWVRNILVDEGPGEDFMLRLYNYPYNKALANAILFCICLIKQ